MAKSSFKIKLSAGMRPYVGRVVRGGRVQKAFAEGPGKAVGGCVRSALAGKKGQFGAGQIKDIVRKCARDNWRKGQSLDMGRSFAHITGSDIPR
tara:strand:+ start:239 stop:520 length:282 start_codon:yes stop_codon:yes gene_type:complete